MNEFNESSVPNEPEKIEQESARAVEIEQYIQVEQAELHASNRLNIQRGIGVKTAILCCVACFLVGAIVALSVVPNPYNLWIGNDNLYSKLYAVESVVNNNFKYIDDVEQSKLSDMLAWGYVYGLGDPYSAYYDAEQFDSLKSTYAGQSYGIGISGVWYDGGDGIYIARVTPKSPAEAAGLKKGDIISHVDGDKVTAENYSEMMDAIRGNIGTAVKLRVKRDTQTLELSAVRGEFATESVYGEMLGTVGYINITTFNESTAPQFNNILDSHIEKGAIALVIDVRDNTGGLVDSACDVLDRLLGECDLGYAVYQDGSKKVLGRSDKKCVDMPISVIMNGRSASSSELFAAALRDKGNAKLVGEKSFGKGIMQSTYPLGDGSAVRVTVAEIYTAGGNQYHGKGLEPDVKAGYTEEQAKTWFLLEGENDPYIAAAIKALK